MMDKKESTHQKGTTGHFERKAPPLPSVPADAKRGARHETSVLSGKERAYLREEASNLRRDTVNQKEKSLHLRRNNDRAEDEPDSHTEALLREANEQLVVATVRAQTMTETAQRTAAQKDHMAKHDILTGLPNRALLNDRLERSIALAKRQGKKVALMYIDIDHFKHINDSLGHLIGDQLLQSIASRLRACVRLSDTVSRQGGDEFVVLLADVEDEHGASLTAQKLIETVAEPHVIGIHRLHVTLSIGISLFPDHGKDIESVIRNADTAMYHAKKKGRNNYQVFTPDMKVLAMRRQSVKQALYHALEHNKFVLHYQPKMNLKTGAITGVEALLRWQRSNQRLAYPKQFISIAEDCGLIGPIGQWALGEACRQAQSWLQSGLYFGQIAVNISAVEFRGRYFLAGVRNILHDTGLDPHYLTFELTETGMMQDTQQTMETFKELKDMGIKIAIDDFGTGYSSLSYLHSFPIDELKIDQSFVQAINSDSGDAIVSAVIAIGKSLKQRVVAEGIETKKQFDFLQAQHCAEGQGFFLSRPATADGLTQQLSGVVDIHTP